MADKKAKKAPKPRHLSEDRVRICGRWQKKGYTPDDEEMEVWKKRCKDRDLDPKTGKPKATKPASDKK